MAHLCEVDKDIKKLLSYNRLSVEIFVKLEALKEDDQTNDSKKMLKKLESKTDQEENFFLNEEEKNALNDVKQFEDTSIFYDDVDSKFESGEKLDRHERHEIDCEKGFFLQMIYSQILKKQIHIYNEMVDKLT